MATRQMKKTDKVEVNDEVKEVKVETKPKKKFSSDDYILCHSIIAGGLHVNCRSGNFYVFKDYGSEQEIEYRDLADLVHKHSDHIFMPRIIIDDDDFVEEFPAIKRLYNEMYTTADLREILSLPDNQLVSIVTNMPNEIKETLKSLAATMIGNGEIDSIRKVQTLTDVFGADFTLLSELFARR